jgi:hypothetical protein
VPIGGPIATGGLVTLTMVASRPKSPWSLSSRRRLSALRYAQCPSLIPATLPQQVTSFLPAWGRPRRPHPVSLLRVTILSRSVTELQRFNDLVTGPSPLCDGPSPGGTDQDLAAVPILARRRSGKAVRNLSTRWASRYSNQSQVSIGGDLSAGCDPARATGQRNSNL